MNESLSVALDNPDVAEAFAEAEVGDQCIVTATVLNKDEAGLKASIDTVEYEGYEYDLHGEDAVGGEAEKPADETVKPKTDGLVVMVGVKKPKK